MYQPFRGIEGLTGREPIGAVLRIGIKGPKGAPVNRDRFYIVAPKRDNTGCRPLHPAFGGYHKAAPEHRRSLECVLVHAGEADCFGYQLMCYRAKGLESHPDGFPSCSGDGHQARRWDGSDWQDIPCPGEHCRFRQEGSGNRGVGRACKPDIRLLF